MQRTSAARTSKCINRLRSLPALAPGARQPTVSEPASAAADLPVLDPTFRGSVSVERVLRLQRLVGNTAVRGMITHRQLSGALRPVVQRMAVAGVAVAIDGLSPDTARTHLTDWQGQDKAKPKVTFASDEEILQLIEQSLSDTPEVIRYRANLKMLETEPGKLLDALGFGPGNSVAIRKIKTLLQEAKEKVQDQPKGWKISCSTRDRAALEKGVTSGANGKSGSIERLLKNMREAAASVGLPTLKEQTVADFTMLEKIKGRARSVRRPLNELLTKYVGAVDKILPGALIVYRGSLTRGVKSPKKFTFQKDGIALAVFDAPEFSEAIPKKVSATVTEHMLYDCDANIEVPQEVFKRHRLVTGSLSENDQSNEIVQKLVLIQKAIDEDIKKSLPAKMPGMDVDGGFEFYLNSANKAEAQLSIGTPYPPYMVKNFGLPGLAADLPKAQSAELVNKVVDYSDKRKYKGKLLPLAYWQPYFADLYTHIKEKGPEAVFMPEVQVVVGTGGVQEYTQSATPVDTAKLSGPQDVLAGKAWIGPARGAADVVVGAHLYATVAQKIVPRNVTKKPYVFVNLGGGQQAICFDASVPPVGAKGIFFVKNVPAERGMKPVVNWEGL
jgi:hypothetical protein